jgi:hypothetical protein
MSLDSMHYSSQAIAQNGLRITALVEASKAIKQALQAGPTKDGTDAEKIGAALEKAVTDAVTAFDLTVRTED